MLRELPKKLELVRVCAGPYASSPGDRFGFFFCRLRPDGPMLKMLASTGDGWDHVSVSVANKRRCPTWEEMCTVKDLFFGPDETAVQYHPAVRDYVNFHPYCLHLWRPQSEFLPLPDPAAVGPKQ